MYDPRFDYGGERGRRDRRPRIDYDREERRAAAPLGWRNASGHDDRVSFNVSRRAIPRRWLLLGDEEPLDH